jgi:ubiquinone/menaquinone biosynthesis C-methylase UbiE
LLSKNFLFDCEKIILLKSVGAIIKQMFSSPEKNLEQFHVDPGMIVADFGSGSGHYTFELSKKVGNSGKVYAIDVQNDLLTRLKTHAKEMGFKNIEVVWGDFEELRGTTLSDGIIDRVVVANVMFQLEEKDIVIKEVKRILKPKGQVFVIDWSDSYNNLGPTANMVVKKDVMITLFESEGFKLDKEINVGDHHYGLIFKKI